ncbi:MAG: pentapeptide repeat-containing protein [Candidatus Hodarchaeales archaeon]
MLTKEICLLTKKELEEKVKRGEPLHNIDFTEMDFREANLKGANFWRDNLTGTNFEKANLEEANLIGTFLWRANLREANLKKANIWKANLNGANLIRADLHGANLAYADLNRTNFGGAKLIGANLIKADLTRANLTQANLTNTNLDGAVLIGANLKGTIGLNPSKLLLAYWGNLSDKTTIALMRLDAANHPKGEEAFNEWAAGGLCLCPYLYCRFNRIVNFEESNLLWRPGPAPTMYEAMCMILDEKCPGWND